MDSQQLKQAIIEDIRTIKTISPEIIPARIYYGALFKEMFSGFWKMFLILFLTASYILRFNDDKDPMKGLELITSSSIIAFFLSVFAMLIFLNIVSCCVQFRFHLEKKLKTGPLVVKKCKQISMVFFGIFALFCILLARYTYGFGSLLMLTFAFALSFFATSMVVNLELNRIGMSAIFTVISEFFSQSKGIHREHHKK